MSLKHRIIQIIAPEYAEAPERINILRRHLQSIQTEYENPMLGILVECGDEEQANIIRDYRDKLIPELAQQALKMDNDLYDGGTRKYRNMYGSLNSW